MSFPSNKTVPCVGFNNLPKDFNNVDFPEPFGPIILIISDLSTLKFNLSAMIFAHIAM